MQSPPIPPVGFPTDEVRLALERARLPLEEQSRLLVFAQNLMANHPNFYSRKNQSSKQATVDKKLLNACKSKLEQITEETKKAKKFERDLMNTLDIADYGLIGEADHGEFKPGNIGNIFELIEQYKSHLAKLEILKEEFNRSFRLLRSDCPRVAQTVTYFSHPYIENSPAIRTPEILLSAFDKVLNDLERYSSMSSLLKSLEAGWRLGDGLSINRPSITKSDDDPFFFYAAAVLCKSETAIRKAYSRSGTK